MPLFQDRSGLRLGLYLRQETQRRAVALQRADVCVGGACLDPTRPAPGLQPGVDERANVLVAAVALQPEPVQRVEDGAGHLEGPPDPIRAGLRLLYPDLAHAALGIEDHGIEQLRPLHREPGKVCSACSGNQIVSGRPTNTASSSATRGAARKMASQSPAGSGCTT
jgi:hypothetical protein